MNCTKNKLLISLNTKLFVYDVTKEIKTLLLETVKTWLSVVKGSELRAVKYFSVPGDKLDILMIRKMLSSKYKMKEIKESLLNRRSPCVEKNEVIEGLLLSIKSLTQIPFVPFIPDSLPQLYGWFNFFLWRNRLKIWVNFLCLNKLILDGEWKRDFWCMKRNLFDSEALAPAQ